MSSSQLPFFRCQWQRQSQLDSHSGSSFLISLLRGLAALEVTAAHLRAEVFPGLRELADPPLYYQVLAFVTGFSHHAVIIFFLISGWLVGGSLLNKLGQPGAIKSYAIDRATRLWMVLLPALFIMLAIGSVTGVVSPARSDFSAANEYSVASFAGNLLGLQTILVDPFAGNYALWSLANETWYYLQFPLLLLVFTGKTWLRQVGAATVLVLLGAALPLPITLYFALWLLGAAFSRIRIDCATVWRVALLLLALVFTFHSRLVLSIDDLKLESFLPHLTYSLPLLALLASMHGPIDLASGWRRGMARMTHLLSEFSFTLYVLHVPLIDLLRHIGLRAFGRNRLAADAPLDYAIYFGILLALLLLSYCAYLLFESHTFRVRRLVKNALQPGYKRPRIASASLK